MLYDKAFKIAQEFMNDMNPTMWDGNGDVPSTFDDRCLGSDLSPDMRLDISFLYDNEDGWRHCCELVNVASNEMVEILTGYGIDSVQNLANAILDICKNYN